MRFAYYPTETSRRCLFGGGAAYFNDETEYLNMQHYRVSRSTAPREHYHQTGSKTTDREQRQLAEKSDPKYIFTIPIAILPQLSLCDEITVTKPLLRGQLTWLAQDNTIILLVVYWESIL